MNIIIKFLIIVSLISSTSFCADDIDTLLENFNTKKKNLFLDLNKEFNSVFNDFLKGRDALFAEFDDKDLNKFQPKINLNEKDNEYILTAELPGMDEKEIEIEVKGNSLILKGEKKEKFIEKKEDSQYSEIKYGAFSRQIYLPEKVEVEKIEATFKNGLLTINLPKSKKAKVLPKKIKIKTE